MQTKRINQQQDPWLEGLPPNGWKNTRVKNEATLSPNYSTTPPRQDELCTVVPMESVSESGLVDTTLTVPLDTISGGLPLFERDDVIFAKITPCMENGKGAHIAYLPTRYAFGSTEFHVLRPSRTAHAKFLYYYTFNPTFRAYAAENMTGAAGQKRVTSRFLKETRLFLPPRPEQERIAAYLDEKCAAIDAAVAAKRRQIGTLEDTSTSIINDAVTRGLKPGVPLHSVYEEWLGQVPAHWDVCRIKRIVSRVDYGISESTEREGRFPVLKMGNIQSGKIVLKDIEYVESVEPDLLLEQGDVLYNRTNSPDQVGKAAVYRGSTTDAYTFASYLVRLRANHRADPYYLNYLLNSSGFLTFARKMAIPSVQQSNLNSTRYCRMLIPLPPLKEQALIRSYLDEQTRTVRLAVTNIESQIATLTAYRKSLIHECVTGQRRV